MLRQKKGSQLLYKTDSSGSEKVEAAMNETTGKINKLYIEWRSSHKEDFLWLQAQNQSKVRRNKRKGFPNDFIEKRGASKKKGWAVEVSIEFNTSGLELRFLKQIQEAIAADKLVIKNIFVDESNSRMKTENKAVQQGSSTHVWVDFGYKADFNLKKMSEWQQWVQSRLSKAREGGSMPFVEKFHVGLVRPGSVHITVTFKMKAATDNEKIMKWVNGDLREAMRHAFFGYPDCKLMKGNSIVSVTNFPIRVKADVQMGDLESAQEFAILLRKGFAVHFGMIGKHVVTSKVTSAQGNSMDIVPREIEMDVGEGISQEGISYTSEPQDAPDMDFSAAIAPSLRTDSPMPLKATSSHEVYEKVPIKEEKKILGGGRESEPAEKGAKTSGVSNSRPKTEQPSSVEDDPLKGLMELPQENADKLEQPTTLTRERLIDPAKVPFTAGNDKDGEPVHFGPETIAKVKGILNGVWETKLADGKTAYSEIHDMTHYIGDKKCRLELDKNNPYKVTLRSVGQPQLVCKTVIPANLDRELIREIHWTTNNPNYPSVRWVRSDKGTQREKDTKQLTVCACLVGCAACCSYLCLHLVGCICGIE